MVNIILGAVIFAIGVLFGVSMSHNSKTEDGFTLLARVIESKNQCGEPNNYIYNNCLVCGVLPGKYTTPKQANEEFRHHMRTLHAEATVEETS